MLPSDLTLSLCSGKTRRVIRGLNYVLSEVGSVHVMKKVDGRLPGLFDMEVPFPLSGDDGTSYTGRDEDLRDCD